MHDTCNMLPFLLAQQDTCVEFGLGSRRNQIDLQIRIRRSTEPMIMMNRDSHAGWERLRGGANSSRQCFRLELYILILTQSCRWITLAHPLYPTSQLAIVIHGNCRQCEEPNFYLILNCIFRIVLLKPKYNTLMIGWSQTCARSLMRLLIQPNSFVKRVPSSSPTHLTTLASGGASILHLIVGSAPGHFGV